MLYISRWKATAILLTALIVCLCAVPNFFSEARIKTWPAWAQRHIVLGLDLQGGSHILLEVDTNDVLKQKVAALVDDVRKLLRQERIGLTRAPVARGNSVEVSIREADFQRGLAKLRELLEIPQEDIIAVGDGGNDIHLFASAGFNVAMGNAVPELKAAADLVAPGVEEDGLAWAVETLILQAP